MFNNKIKLSWSVNSINKWALALDFVGNKHPTEFNLIVYLIQLFNFSEWIFKFNQNPTIKKPHFQNKLSSGWIKILRKPFICLSLIDNTMHIIYGIRTRTLIYSFFFYLIVSYFLFQHIDLGLSYYLFLSIPLTFFSWTNSAYFSI